MSTLFSNRRVRTLKRYDDSYYEFMHFDVPKLVRSPGCDHRHDEESRNGRDINIDILEAYIDILDFTGLPGGCRNPPGGKWAYWGLVEKREEAAHTWPVPPTFPKS